MSFHNNPKYQIPELIQALKDHGLEHDTPSQLADAFRTGWTARTALLANAAGGQAEPVAWLRPDPIDAISAKKKSELEQFNGKPGVKIAAQYTVALYTAPPLPVGAPQGVTDARLEQIWKACKSIDNRAFCVEFGRAVLLAATPPSAALTPLVAAPQAAVDAEMEDLTPDEVEAILRALEVDHKPSDYEPECPGCTAYQKIAAIRAEQKG